MLTLGWLKTSRSAVKKVDERKKGFENRSSKIVVRALTTYEWNAVSFMCSSSELEISDKIVHELSERGKLFVFSHKHAQT